MPVDIKQFSGLLNSDDSNDVMESVHHKFAMNGRFRGLGNKMRFENVEGTTLLSNPYLPAGTNLCIGAFYDELNHIIFSFNCNSNSNHAIYQYDLSTSLWSRIAMVGYNTDGDILGFTVDGNIYAVKMLYGDATEGNTLYFNNSQKEPCQINITKALAGTYGTIKRSFIDVIKAPAIMPPSVTYEDDATVSVNNLRKKLFKFKTRFVYINKDKSVWSSQSLLPLPVNYTDSLTDSDSTKNSRIAIVVPTGEKDVTQIEIAASQSITNTFSDYFLIKVIDKAISSIPDNDITAYRFFNNQSYIPIDPTDSIQLFDLVPLQANALELLNGNVPIYGGILEGYNKTVVNGTATSSYETEQTTQPKFLFISNQSGDSGFGTGNIHTILIGTITVSDVYAIITTNYTLSFTAAATTAASVLTGLAAAAITAGFTIVLNDGENLIIFKTGESLQSGRAVPVNALPSDSFVYDRNSRYNFVVDYFDAAGRSIGSLTNDGMNVQTINYTESGSTPNIPVILLYLYSRPPLYAAYFQIGRTKNITKLTKLEWVSDRTFKGTDPTTGISYAYISIESLNAFISTNPSSAYLSYQFSPNDRIRFMKVLSGSVHTVYTNNDFEIVSQELSPTINGTIYTGQFIKILLPTTSGTFDFGTTDFFNYFIELYSPAQSVAGGLDVDYEYGERYTIGNAGTVNAYHQGMTQNQTPDLVTPATFSFTQGDYYYRNRKINTGDTISYNLIPGILSWLTTLGQTQVKETLPSTNFITALGVTQQHFNDNYNTPGWTINVLSSSYIFTVTGTINLRAINSTSGLFSVTVYIITGTSTVTRVLGTQTGATAGENIVFNVNNTIPMSANTKMFVVLNATDTNFRINLVSGNLTYSDLSKIYSVNIIDPNFSDYFQSAVNSNGRSWFVDPNAAQVFNAGLMRWGLAYEPGTNINQSNRFRPLNFDDIDISKGQIQIFKARNRILRVFQERGCGQCGIYAKFIQDSSGTNTLTTTNDIITKNNIQYYEGIYGLGNQPTGLVSSKIDDYFIDPVRGYQLRLGGDGLIPISELYKGQFYIQPLFPPYTQDYIRPNGATSKILGYYNYFEEEYVTILQGGTLGINAINDYAFAFNEKRNSYCTFFDFHPEFMLSAKDVTYSFKNGQLYVHDNKTNYSNFYGTQYYPSILLVFNKEENIKKTFMALSYQANVKWTCENDGDILTNQPNPQTGFTQISKLKDFDFNVQEGVYYAAFKRDINSGTNPLDAWYNGDYLKGTNIQVQFTYNGSDYAYLFLPTLNWIVSPRN